MQQEDQVKWLYLNYKLVIVLNIVEQLNLGNFNKYSYSWIVHSGVTDRARTN